ncbi:MAG: CHAT domain-containing protein [Caldilinea sp. CFX5]|nr:CHAT domain-containing protein [Caldilinea sp. CFX5]
MLVDLGITITSAEPTAGDNVIVYDYNTTTLGAFRLSAVADAVAQLNVALDQGQPDDALWKSVGGALFDELLGGGLLRRYAAAMASGQRVRLRLMSNTPELLAVPWEYLYDRTSEQPLALHPNLSLVRSLPTPGRKLVAVEGQLRLLVMISNPTDLPGLDAMAEWANLVNATTTAALEVIRIDPTYEAFQSALREHKPHIFHFVGHGRFDSTTQAGLLYLQKADGSAIPCAAEQMATLLSGCETLRLALLNACQGATPGYRSAFAGVAQKLIQQGLPAVIAMQAPIRDTDALLFSQEFYRALADGYHLEAALGEGRKRMAEHSTAWGVPALYLQDSEPFVLPVLTDGQKAEHLWLRLPTTNEPAQQRALLTRILALDPAHAGAQNAVAQIEKSRKAARFYDAAQASKETAAWREAYQCLLEVERLAPNFCQTRRLLAEVKGHLDGAPIDTIRLHGQFDEYKAILDALQYGRLVPFLGWDVSRFGRPAQDGWVAGLYPPSADEAARELAQRLPEPLAGKPSLPEISQHTTLLEQPGALYDRLTDLYQASYTPTLFHRLLAELAGRLRAKGYPVDPKRRLIIFSTALDQLLEEAFQSIAQPYHLFAYQHPGDDGSTVQPACFVHLPPSGEAIPLVAPEQDPNRYQGHLTDQHPIIIKLCGQGVASAPERLIVTEDHYLNRLPQEIGALLPMTLLEQFRRSSLLCFGYSLRPWYFRLLWQRLRIQQRRLLDGGWAIVPNLNRLEEAYWRDQGIAPIEAAPEAVVAYINEWLDQLEARI